MAKLIQLGIICCCIYLKVKAVSLNAKKSFQQSSGTGFSSVTRDDNKQWENLSVNLLLVEKSCSRKIEIFWEVTLLSSFGRNEATQSFRNVKANHFSFKKF